MIRDLASQTEDVVLTADVHVIGAGIAGLLTATRMAKAGATVIVSESGGEHQEAETHPLNRVLQLRSVYQGAEHGRFRCLGGTSTRWGGAMIPFLPSDMSAQDGRRWPIPHSELTGYQDEVETLFRLPSGPYEEPDLFVANPSRPAPFLARLAKWPPFVRRNVARLLERDLRDPAGPEVWLNATVCGMAVSPDVGLSSVTASAPGGRNLSVTARHTILAAGAIESTRLLLLMDRAHAGALFARADILGRFFHDHLSVCVGTIRPTDRRALNRIIGFRFEENGMRNLRFELSDATQLRKVLPACFAHVAVGADQGSGFDLLRTCYRQLQKRKLPSAATMFGLATQLPWLARAGWWYRRERRLLFPPGAELQLHMVIEQVPRDDNRLTLSETEVDAHGQPLAVIDWSIGDADRRNMLAATRSFAEFWSTSTLSRLGTIELRDEEEIVSDLDEGGGIYHPGGTTRMGRDASEAVVDRDLTVFGVPNLTVLSTSTFPSGGGANPTMMLMMACLRAADQILEKLRCTMDSQPEVRRDVQAAAD